MSTTHETLVVENTTFLSGPYRLQAELAYVDAGSPIGLAVIAGPHPLLGGHMHNNVVRGIGDGLAERGLLTVRFNYRGVGGSEGLKFDVVENVARFFETSHVSGELDLWQDVQAAVAFVQQAGGSELPLALVGYSFGCTLLSRPRPDAAATALVLIAPTIAKHDYAAYLDNVSPKLVIASEDDFATNAQFLRHWFARLREPKQLLLERFDNHFFRGYEDRLTETIAQYLESHWRLNPCP